MICSFTQFQTVYNRQGTAIVCVDFVYCVCEAMDGFATLLKLFRVTFRVEAPLMAKHESRVAQLNAEYMIVERLNLLQKWEWNCSRVAQQ
mmetsp:Transcript_60725/g.67954  ORF Transcript_60725/g.67954 Transcript_60725/m.67954 type:complete len:90 (-) Transcript_60725:8-277(-)